MRFDPLAGLCLVGKFAVFRRARMPGNRLGSRALAWLAAPSAPPAAPAPAHAVGGLARFVLAGLAVARIAVARVATLGLMGVVVVLTLGNFLFLGLVLFGLLVAGDRLFVLLG